jgi:hypothetical protein
MAVAYPSRVSLYTLDDPRDLIACPSSMIRVFMRVSIQEPGRLRLTRT